MSMNAVSDLVVPKELLNKLHLSPDEMLIELATHLYAVRRLNMGHARRLANLDLMSFQSELAKRNIYINYTVEDLRNDVATLDKLFERTEK